MDSIIAILMLLMGSWRMICSETETQDIATGTESVYEPPSIFSEQEKLAETNSPTPLVPITEGPNLTGHNSSLNSTGSKLKPICTLEQGCVPPLTCVGVNTSLLNDSHMTGVFGKRGVVNVTSAQLETLLDSPVFTNSCLLVLYYATWCPYSVDFMPTYNELGLVFPNDSLTIVALDFGKKDDEKFLLAYIPRVLLYYSGRAVFDVDTSLSIDNLTSILSNMTGLLPLARENVTSEETQSIHIEWEFDSTWYFLGVIGIGLITIINLLKRTSFFTMVAKLRDVIRNLVLKIKTD